MWYDKRFHSLNYELKERFNEKIIKLSIDGGFTCPNRDGTIGHNGCIFCSDMGSGDFAGSRTLSIKSQIDSQIKQLHNKWPNAKYIAYFQNFTSTYDSVENLRLKYEEALQCENIVGIAIATRPDCLNDEILDLISELNKKTFLWIELGLQSIHKFSADFIRRGYELDVFTNSLSNLNKRNIKTVAHVIINLPNESLSQILETINFLNESCIWGIKLHMFHVLKNTDLYESYKLHPFILMPKDKYIETIVKCLENLNPNIIIHRMTGDGKKSDLIAPLWSLDKRSVLNGIDKYLAKNNTFQGKYFQSFKG